MVLIQCLPEKQIEAGQDTEAGNDLPEPLAVHPISCDDTHIKTEQFKKRHPHGHSVVYGSAQDVGYAARCSGHHLQWLSDGYGIQRRKPHADHEGNGKNGASDSCQTSHETNECAQKKQGEALRSHGTGRHVKTDVWGRTQRTEPGKEDQPGKDKAEPVGRKKRICLCPDIAAQHGSTAHGNGLLPVDAAFFVMQPCPEDGHESEREQCGRHRLMDVQRRQKHDGGDKQDTAYARTAAKKSYNQGNQRQCKESCHAIPPIMGRIYAYRMVPYEVMDEEVFPLPIRNRSGPSV